MKRKVYIKVRLFTFTMLIFAIIFFIAYKIYIDVNIIENVEANINEKIQVSEVMLTMLSVEEKLDVNPNPVEIRELENDINQLIGQLERSRSIDGIFNRIAIQLKSVPLNKSHLLRAAIEDTHAQLEHYNVQTYKELQNLIRQQLKREWHITVFFVLSFFMIYMIAHRMLRDFRRLIRVNKELNTDLKHKNKFIQFTHQIELLNNFSGGLAHEINNALMIIQGRTELLKCVQDEDKTHAYLDIILQQVNFISGLIKQILITANKRHSKLTPQRIGTSVSKIIESNPHKDKINFHNDLVKNFIIEFNQEEMKIIINELVANAVYFSNDQIEVCLSVAKNIESAFLDKGDIYVELKVIDKGCGIENVDAIFNPFYTTKEVGDGKGLGLIMVMNFVRGMNGDIHVKSEGTVGSTFVIYLPVVEESLQQVEEF